MPRVAVVTDSTSLVTPDAEVTVVPVQVVVGDESFADGLEEVSPSAVIGALAAKKSVSTSRPSPSAFAETYASLAAAGHDAIVSIHVSSKISGTTESAELAAAESPIPVTVVDSLAVGPSLGMSVMAAAAAAARGASAEQVAAAALERSSRSHSFFYVDSLEPMRRGGRIGARAALVGSALAVKPLLGLRDGRVVLLEKVRTTSRALIRLEELAVEAAGDGPVEIVVAHLGALERAEAVAARLADRVELGAPVRVIEFGPGLAAHLGTGAVAVVVAPAV
ncbi:DegV domain-containing protein [Nocardioides baekrokdamisoli]|uniref:DegV domain-containing protein n=1 Tax=Nocardioides baekrokdamisoli TaxID=1804624 RepID=A0A3G9IJ68_9ACTN|nr:DegV family protein [Nocardioides baekrokdamisoli]BBH16105.1 DegV domain-containing protein [Nocardioides baekrokdamisoli]